MNAADEAPRRIASLLASGTELVCALGLGERLVARSHECDFPAWIKRLPAVSRPTFDIGGTSADIDGRVRERLRAGAPLYEVDDGHWRLTYRPERVLPVADWLSAQKRFAHLFTAEAAEVLAEAQRRVDDDWTALLERCEEAVCVAS